MTPSDPSADQGPSSPHSAGVLAPPPAIYLLGLLLGFLLQRWRPLPLLAPPLGAALACVFLLAGLVGVPALLAFRRARTSPKPWRPTTALVTTGPYRFSRNPMYLGFTAIYLGVALWANALWPVLLLPVVLITMQFGVIHREEAYLERLFGAEYRAYRQRVRRWL